jgi:hypothetical protein
MRERLKIIHPKIFSRQGDFPTMPKRQPCPQCRRQCKMAGQTLGGANYSCPVHGRFFIKKGSRT